MDYIRLYHLSLALDDVIEFFIPGIPSAIMLGEDDTIPRVCASSSIEGALSAVPWGGRKLEEIYEYHEENIIEGEDYEKIQIRVYEFLVPLESVIPPGVLYERGLVEDAKETNEYWINSIVEPAKVYDIYLSGWREESFDRLSYLETLRLETEEGTPYDEIWSGGVGTKIVDVDFIQGNDFFIKEAI